MRIKGQGRITKYICQKISQNKKKKFLKLLNANKLVFQNSSLNVKIEIVSISGKNQFCDQILSIISFIVNIGIPQKWTLYSDGSYTEEEFEIFKYLFGTFIEINHWDSLNNNFLSKPDVLKEYALKLGIGKKTYVVFNHRSKLPFLFADSDIVFYSKFKDYLHLFAEQGLNYYMAENDWVTLDSFYMNNYKRDMFQTNSGLLFINPDFNWNTGVDYLIKISKLNSFEFFTDQTSIHISLKKNISEVFDPRFFCVDMRDHFWFNVFDGRKKIAVRHFVGPIRHKMWQKGWKWHVK